MDSKSLQKALMEAVQTHVRQERQQASFLRTIDRLAVDSNKTLLSAMDTVQNNALDIFGGHNKAFVRVDDSIYPFKRGIKLRKCKFKERGKIIHKDKDNSLFVKSIENEIYILIELEENSYFVFFIKADSNTLSTLPRRFIKQFADQLNVLVRTKLLRETWEKERHIVDALLASSLKEPQIWQQLLEALIDYAPSWCPGKGAWDITQFLIARHDERTMHLVAGEGSDTFSEFFLMNESVTGQAATECWTQPRLVQTNADDVRYIGYTVTGAKYEFVVPVVYNDTVIAVLNLEGDEKDSFNSLVGSFYEEAAVFLAPIIRTILDRSSRFRASEVRLQYILSDMLQRFGGTFSHLISQPFLSSKLAAGEIKYLLRNESSNIKQITEEADSLSKLILGLEKDCLDFIEKLPSFLNVGPQNIGAAIRTRLGPLKKRATVHGIDVFFDFRGTQGKGKENAYASNLFAEHVFNICYNSFQHIFEKMDRGTFPFKRGRISITSKFKKSVSPSGEVKGVDFIEVVVRDNGGGMSQELLLATREGKTTKVGGNGFAIPAAIEYFASIGGEMTYGNFRNGLQTVIKMQAYSPNRHTTRPLKHDTASDTIGTTWEV